MMNQIENEFLDTYKRIDKICADMYSTDNGIKEYLSQMEQKANIGRYKVTGWEESFRSLKHLKWLRNQLVHDVNPEECTEEDLYCLNNFYHQIMSQQDPLAMLYKANQTVSVKPFVDATRRESEKQVKPAFENRESNKKHMALIVIAAIIVIVIVLMLIVKV